MPVLLTTIEIVPVFATPVVMVPVFAVPSEVPTVTPGVNVTELVDFTALASKATFASALSDDRRTLTAYPEYAELNLRKL